MGDGREGLTKKEVTNWPRSENSMILGFGLFPSAGSGDSERDEWDLLRHGTRRR
jgi:hypothetical protein